MSKPKYKYLIYRILKNFREPYYDYVKVYYYETSCIIHLVLRKNVDVPNCKVSTHYFKTGITTELYKSNSKLLTKSYDISKNLIEHLNHEEIINNIKTDFEESIKRELIP